MLADETDFVIGVDTHRDRHSAAIVNADRRRARRTRPRRIERRLPQRVGARASSRGRPPRVGDRGHWLLRRGSRTLPRSPKVSASSRSIDRADARDARAPSPTRWTPSAQLAKRSDVSSSQHHALAGQRDGLRALVMHARRCRARTHCGDQPTPRTDRGWHQSHCAASSADWLSLSSSNAARICAQALEARSDRPLVTALRSCAQRVRALQHETRELRRQILELVRDSHPH